MSAISRSTTRSEPRLYVHKLRLESRDGASVEISPTISLTQVGSRIVVKLIAAALVAALLLTLLRAGLVA